MANEIAKLSEEIAQILTHTLSADKGLRKAAEGALSTLERSNLLYGSALLYLTKTQGHLASAIAFKNFIKKHWSFNPNDESSDQSDIIDPNQREFIKQNITTIMLESSEHIQRQLSEAITIIAESDFPDKWETLLPELKNSIEHPGTLLTAHSIFRKYRYQNKSDKLWTEINLVMVEFAPVFTERFKQLVAATRLSANQDHLKIYQSILLATKIYHSLITQDLPDFFEEKINEWFPLFLELLNLPTKNVATPESTVIDDIKAEICEIASLFVQMYSNIENFGGHARSFLTSILSLLVTTNQDIQYDTLVSVAIRYLVTIAERPESRPMFQDKNDRKLLYENVIIPNLTLRDVDEELFEDDPEEYIKRDIEGSDVETRRRAACDLVKALSKYLEAELVEELGLHITEMLNAYQLDKKLHWRKKDLAIFLYSSLAIKGSTRQSGTVSISRYTYIEDPYIWPGIVEELADDSSLPILKADALRYITIFRNYIRVETLYSCLPLIVKHITSNSMVVKTYASITLEKLLTLRDKSQPAATALRPELIDPNLGELLGLLMDALDDNEHVMRAVMRLISFPNLKSMPDQLPHIIPRLANILISVAQNPSKPYFNHYLFETFALTIRLGNPQAEECLFQFLDIVIEKDVQEFIQYILQLLNLVLQKYSPGNVSPRFVEFFQKAIQPLLWEKPANTKPLVELMHSYIIKMGHQIVAMGKLDAVLGIFQKLIASKATDHEGLALLQTMMIHLPVDSLDERIGSVFFLLFQRLDKRFKTNKFVKNALVCFSLYAHLRGTEQLAKAMNQSGNDIFGRAIQNLYIADAKKVTGAIERRICACGIIKILSQLPFIDNGAHNHLWGSLLLVLMEIFELPPEVDRDEDDHFVDIQGSLDFQAHYAKLSYASVKRADPIREVGDLKTLLATSLANLNTSLPGFVSTIFRDHLDQSVVSCLKKYFQAANVALT